MKRILLLLTVSAWAACPVLAQDTNSPSSTPPPDGPPPGGHMGHGPMGFLTQDEREEMKAARDAAFKANPALETEGKELQEKMKAYQKEVDTAMINADPKVAPIVAKMEAHRPPHGGPGGPPPPPGN